MVLIPPGGADSIRRFLFHLVVLIPPGGADEVISGLSWLLHQSRSSRRRGASSEGSGCRVIGSRGGERRCRAIEEGGVGASKACR